MTTRARNSWAAAWIRSSSVAITTSVRYRAWQVRSHTCWSIVLPAMEARALPGKREEEYRAGITPRIRCGTLEYSTMEAIRGGFPGRSIGWNFVCTEVFMSWYNQVRLRATMRSLLAIAVLGMSLLPLAA